MIVENTFKTHFFILKRACTIATGTPRKIEDTIDKRID
jgi:hypothetical protein